MSRESIIFLLGALVFFMPYLGIPVLWKTYFYAGTGLLLMVFGYTLRRRAYLRSLETKEGERTADSFVESNYAAKDSAEPIDLEEEEVL